MKALLLTNEYPPYTYGGAGVHLEYLSRELARLMQVEVRCFGDQREKDANPAVWGFGVDKSDFGCPDYLASIMAASHRCVHFNSAGVDADVVHTHTWYTQLAGIMAKLNYGIPLVTTVHSLEPLRPWKREQLGGGYDFTVWLERTAMEMADAVIAVSSGTRDDVLRLYDVVESKVPIIYNGIDLEEFRPTPGKDALERFGIGPELPFVLFVGRITRQKGIVHLVRAIESMDEGFQVVLCAGAPDTQEIAREMSDAVEHARQQREGVIWIDEMVDKPTLVKLYSEAAAFCCPSIYEPFGIINLEAMACETPVVASAVGGIKEVVVPGETGLLVELKQQQESPFEALEPESYAQDLASAVNELMADAALREELGKAGRRRAEAKFSWKAIAKQTRDLYQTLLKR
jgi:glycogen synthase